MAGKQTTVSFKVSENVKKMMEKYYRDMKCDKTPPYAIFQVKDFDCVTTLYESGKVVFQGIGADIEASVWVAQEKRLNNNVIDTEAKAKDKNKDKKSDTNIFVSDNTIGSDEVGTGDYFGPIVVCATNVVKENHAFLTELGVKDSKKITDEMIIKIAPELIKNIPYKAIVLDNKSFNDNYSSDVNMNKIKAILHNKVLLGLVESDNVNYKEVVVDQFTTPKSYYGYLVNAPKKVTNITFMTKAEDKVLSVACASIIARYIFLKEMKKMSLEYGVNILLGASDKVDALGASLATKYGIDELRKIAKISFKNTDKIKELMRSSK